MNMQRFGLVALAATMALLSACSSKSTTTTTPSPTPTPSAAATSPLPSPSSAASPNSTATASASATATAGAAQVVLHTGTATVSGKSESVLTDARGLTLYYHTTDSPTSVCSGACAAAWPPVLLPSGTPGSSVSLPGTLGVQTNVNGRQVTYNGHLLYRWKNDTSAGQATGEGINNFHVVTPTIAGM